MPITGRGPAARLVLILALSPSAGGCFLLPLGGRPAAPPGGGPSPMGRGLLDFRVAFHCHSHLSHDSRVPFDEIAAAARALGVNAVILNDHYRAGNIARSPHGPWDGVLFIPGVELRPDPLPGGTPDRGSLLAFGFEKDFEEDAPRAELMRDLAGGGAVVAAGHCESFAGWDRYPLHAYEVYNLHTQFKLASRWGIIWRALFLLPDPFFESQVAPPASVIEAYDRRLLEGKRLAPLAGHDAHANVRPLGPVGPTIGTYREVLRLFSNHVLATELTSGSILEGIRRGRVYITFDFLGDASGFAMTYGPAEGTPEAGGSPVGGPGPAILGEETPHRPGWLLRVKGPAGGAIRVLRDGKRWKEVRGPSFEAPLPGPGVYRTEVRRADGRGRDRLWVFSAPLYVGERKG